MAQLENLKIIYQDHQLVAINKPAGLLVHRSMLDRHETRFALQLLRDQLGRRVYPVHRLDKPTSGVLLFALDPQTAQLINAQFQQRQVEKAYLAVVRGWPAERGRIDYPLIDGPQRGNYADQRGSDLPRPAQTDFCTLAVSELPISDGRHPTSRYALVEARPASGRRHQLRRHFKHIYHPIIGDTTYGDGRHNRIFRQQVNSHRLLLHASQLRLFHPHEERPLQLGAPLDGDLQKVLQSTGLLPQGSENDA